MQTIYLAGPEVFLPNALEVLANSKKLCESFGFRAFTPFDGEITEKLQLAKAKQIFEENVSLINQSDIVIANCNPFRGACVDDGTAFEIGYAYSKKKCVFGYVSDKRTLPEIVKSKIQTKPHPSGYAIDNDGFLLNEDFGNSINLMLEFSILNSGGNLVLGDLESVLQILKNRS
ncbi:nucleoside 2-deoxyribosyltransferase [Leptospira sp. 2 VSF19]|uniref:Nucleoside 2-deoxyribosyltransferase n=1 Tax=Leptospira soteropolitanensis TaxID=2950025 RepID=A0AAW5VLL6_9LEPT|nr:nucleoside 2-deoxyribosyltransferase [Leptospira soteropolitanensis]MCW7492512.1 nucleoside 2-deoxyribosyltransferase [Leptospira soteropolitanensis]MCW7500561.1 nucleoside 2-deoxyribosyltransferase [Leptospira soteropolitanensis]MCW7522769.1 nucleoside 2-deoxyribosyltransferase [Leptospira soteropolitanensis]MCW7526626.1 nucleoside 2-deoxyribosyltransferase [Leptospira soteropolitanensis]MCW7530531.1 nucleoside 2-deoxyribosyltransferase [Leptospira soteropolitanensis]